MRFIFIAETGIHVKLPAIKPIKNRIIMSKHAIFRLLSIMQQLRDPQTGCEWDKKQTFSSLIPSTLDEVYEVFDAVERQNYADLQEELGDLLFNLIFYAHLGQEKGEFDFESICQSIADKLIRRHPHIFANTSTDTFSWEKQKRQERQNKQQLSLLDDIPKAFPALLRSQKIQKRSASFHDQNASLNDIVAECERQFVQLKQILQYPLQNDETIRDALGELYFSLVNLTRHLNLEAETVLKHTNSTFEHRFRAAEARLITQYACLENVPPDEWQKVWQAIKYPK